MHPAYYHRAHACILVFDVTRKQTYQHLQGWYDELRDAGISNIPCILVANKIDVDYNVTKKNFKFAAANDLPFFFVSAADGTNIVKVFEEAVKLGDHFKKNNTDFMAEALAVVDSLDGGAK
jgi:Rab-like protein 2